MLGIVPYAGVRPVPLLPGGLIATTLAPHVGAYPGGPGVVGPIATDDDLVDAVRAAGLPAAAVDGLLAREWLTLDESDRLARIARVFAVAEESFGSADKAGR